MECVYVRPARFKRSIDPSLGLAVEDALSRPHVRPVRSWQCGPTEQRAVSRSLLPAIVRSRTTRRICLREQSHTRDLLLLAPRIPRGRDQSTGTPAPSPAQPDDRRGQPRAARGRPAELASGSVADGAEIAAYCRRVLADAVRPAIRCASANRLRASSAEGMGGGKGVREVARRTPAGARDDLAVDELELGLCRPGLSESCRSLTAVVLSPKPFISSHVKPVPRTPHAARPWDGQAWLGSVKRSFTTRAFCPAAVTRR